jgi:quinone-modifying oxidoreductase subunit QmoC
MKERIDPRFYVDLEEFGVKTAEWNECFHCGNCTAICPLTEKGVLFPRKEIRLMQMGLKKELHASAEPWLCYYCGDCSKTCPRDANPAELMMSLRRYLTSVYDWTGLARKIYTSKIWEYMLIFLLAALVLVLYLKFTFYPADNGQWIGEDGGVLINKIAPWYRIHIGDWLMAGVLAFLLITNIFNMWYKIILSDKSLKIPFSAYITQFFSLVWNFLTQQRFNKCDDSKTYWYLHLFLMLSYVSLFAIIVFFLEWFQTDIVHPIWHPQRLIGYIATLGLFSGIFYFIFNRLKKSRQNSKYSHITDWTFLVLLFLTTVTGISLHIFRISGMPVATYYTYVIHLMCLVPMLTIEVPFSKWSHLAYRPFAVYFANLKKSAYKLPQQDS